MTQEDIAYAAGVLEGEGCFGFQRATGKYPKIRMETTDLDVAERVQVCLGCGTIAPVKKRRDNWKQSHVFQISRRDDVERVLIAIYPWMGQRRQAKIQQLLEL